MKLTAVSMVKNESDIIQGFCAHLSALFDNIVIVDHRSQDGTRQYVEKISAADSRFRVLKFEEAGYFQSQLMTWVAKNIEVCKTADWLFFLDADEVLPFESREELDSALQKASLSPIIRLPWKNLVPVDFSGSELFGRSYFLPKGHAQHSKIAYQPHLIPVSDYVIAQGNHAILASPGGGELPSEEGFPLYHAPLRSRDQIGLKIIQGVNSYLKMGESRDRAHGLHWFVISERIVEKGMSDELLYGLAATYGEDVSPQDLEVSRQQLEDRGYSEIVLKAALKPIPVEYQFTSNYSEKVIKTVMDYTAAESKLNCDHDGGALRLTEDNQIEASCDVADGSFGALAGSSCGEYAKKLVTLPDVDFLTCFMEPSYWSVKTLTPTAWGGHIPFMFCLVNALRPRRYVELGSHHGASFFAVCQAMQRADYGAEAIAIDLWSGDEHAGHYGEEVFDNFVYLLKERYRKTGRYIRADFTDASSRFQDGSIDLLHIDGLHTYEAVKNDFRVWKDKLTADGVILFHDTQVRERGFGVWRLWEEIAPEFPSFEFRHTHGLGIIFLGGVADHPVGRLLQMLSAAPVLAAGFERHFSRIGELATEEATHKTRAAGNEEGAGAGATQSGYAYGRMDRICDKVKGFVRRHRLGRFF